MMAEDKFSGYISKEDRSRNPFGNRKISFGLINFAFWTVFAVFGIIHGYAQFNLIGRQTPWVFIFITRMADWYFWALMTPLIFWLGQHLPIKTKKLWQNIITIYIPVGLIISTVHIMSVAFLMSVWSPDNFSFTLMLGKISYFFPFSLLVYTGILAAFYVFDYNRKYKERELQAATLKAELAQAKLHALQMQIQPHFLFNTLNSISALTFKDPQAANSMLVGLSELLRILLVNYEVNEVRLKQELKFLRIYLDIEFMRFDDRLTVDFDIEPATLEAFVPSLLLQPLVENAIKHGISKRRGKGIIEISAKKQKEKLHLKIRDNGLGFSESGNKSFIEGIGLTNTRRRLSGLYGENFFFKLNRLPGKGTEVEMVFPFKTDRYVENTNINN